MANSIGKRINQISSWFELEPVSTQLKLGMSELNVDTECIYSEAKLVYSLGPQYFTVDSSLGVNPQFPCANTNKHGCQSER